jgi:pilus assembly protein Flp/PilA
MTVHNYNKKEEEMKRFFTFLKEEDGASLIEYVLLAALIGVAAIVGMGLVGTRANTTLTDSATAMGS